MLRHIRPPCETAISVIAIATMIALVAMATAIPALANPDRWAAEGWRTDFSQSTVDLGEILDGGPRRDGIPPIDNPRFEPVAEVDHLDPRDPILSFTHKGETRGYPLRVMTFHEIVNDVIAGDPVAVTYCPLCNAAIVFDRMIDGEVVDFGTTGKLRRSDLVMYDRQTDSWWQQFSGEAIAGSYAGTELTMLPSKLISWQQFAEQYPSALVLDDPNNFRRPYGQNPYPGYDTLAQPFLYDGPFPDGIAPLERVVMVRDGDNVFAISTAKIAEEGTIEMEGVTLRFAAGQASALDTSTMSEGRDVGSITVMRDDEPVVHDVTFAFVVYAFEPELEIIQ
ncbi:MAG: DUF3179 domain-containing protein [Pseudomonadota bacterium]